MIISTITLLTSFMIGNAYSGGLSSIVTVPQYVHYGLFFLSVEIMTNYFRYKPPIDNYHQIAQWNVEWGATHDAWIYSILTATEV